MKPIIVGLNLEDCESSEDSNACIGFYSGDGWSDEAAARDEDVKEERRVWEGLLSRIKKADDAVG